MGTFVHAGLGFRGADKATFIRHHVEGQPVKGRVATIENDSEKWEWIEMSLEK